MKALFLSGGQTKFVALVSAANELISKKKYKPKLLAGVSSGAIASVMIALGKIEEAGNIGVNLTLKNIFSCPPITKSGKPTISAIFNVIKGKNYLSEMDNLEKLLEHFMNEDDWDEYRTNPNSIDVYVVAVNASTKARKGWNLKELDHITARKAVLASATMPLVAPAVEIDGEFYYDGGVRDHSPGPYVLEHTKYGSKITELVSVYSRPENYVLPISDSWKKNMFSLMFDFILPTYSIEVSKNDYEFENYFSTGKIDYKAIFIEPFTKFYFDTSRKAMMKGWEYGVMAVKKYFYR